jgi:hypothetical protein
MESSSLSEIKSIPTLVLKDSRFMKWTAIVITIFLFFLPTVEANTRTANSFGTSRILSSKTVSSAAFLKVIGKMTGGAFEKTVEEAAGTENHEETSNQKTANIVFSDVDGTLVHYPDDTRQENEPGNKTIYLPASSTGMRGVISSKTLQLCQKMRREENVKLVLVSGMRTSTLIKRLPYLPKADAYASEAGGRIFYSVPDPGGNMVTPIPFDGATDDVLMSFGLVEDKLWRSKLSEEDAAGMDGYIGDSMDTFLGKQRETAIVPICERKGALWDFCKSLQKKGFVIDYKGYSNCFRVNKKQQNIISEDEFNSLRSLDVSEYGLATSVNLGCIDFYPIYSGKKNWYVKSSCCKTDDLISWYLLTIAFIFCIIQLRISGSAFWRGR